MQCLTDAFVCMFLYCIELYFTFAIYSAEITAEFALKIHSPIKLQVATRSIVTLKGYSLLILSIVSLNCRALNGTWWRLIAHSTRWKGQRKEAVSSTVAVSLAMLQYLVSLSRKKIPVDFRTGPSTA